MTRLIDWLDGLGLGWEDWLHISLAEYQRRLRRRETAWLLALAAAGWVVLVWLGLTPR
jgi:hypothetical protein